MLLARRPARLDGDTVDYTSALAYLNRFVDYERQPDFVRQARFDLARLESVLARMGDPHRKVPTIHLAGSKGKGSTAAMVAAILQACGHTVGLYTSPHLRDFCERIRVNGEKILPAEVARRIETQLRPAIESYQRDPAYGDLTFFEVYTALAFAHFAERATVQVIEVGLGGRLDATNVVQPTVSVITPISWEHAAVLGPTLAAIAWEKAGIIKPGVPVVSGPQTPEVAAVLRAVCEQRGCPLIRADERFSLPCPAARFTPAGSYFTLEPSGQPGSASDSGCRAYPDLFLPLPGPHQVENAATAVAAVEVLQAQGWPLPPEAVTEGLAKVRKSGCVQVVREHPWVVLDGAHNRASAERLAETLQLLFFGGQRKGRLRVILGSFRDKDVAGVAAALAPQAAEMLLTTTGHGRALSPEEIRAALGPLDIPVELQPNLATALSVAQARASQDDVIAVTGSLQLVGEALRILDVEVP